MPDTSAYLILGLAAITLIVGFLIVSMVVRQRNLDRDLDLIQQLRENDE